jgi:hypothetical protein
MLMVNQLIGFGVGGAPALASVSQPASATSTGETIDWPSVQAGDMAILFDFATNGVGTPPSVTPSGFTNMCDAGAATTRGMTSFKRCTGAESGSLTGMNGTADDRKAMVILRGNVPFATITGADGENGAIGSGDPSAITVNASSGTPPLLVIGAYRSTGAVDPRTFSTTKDGEVSFHSNAMYIAWKLYLASPADTNIDMDDEGSNNLVQGFYATLTV